MNIRGLFLGILRAMFSKRAFRSAAISSVCALVASSGVLLVGPSLVARAATITVSNTNDSGPGSLRQAITDANTNAGSDVIDATGVSGTITLGSALPTVSTELTINGPGEASLTISGADLYRPFTASGAIFTLNDLTVSHGANGFSGLLSVANSTVSANRVTFRDMTHVAYGVYNNGNGAVATYTNCTFRNMVYAMGSDYGNSPTTTSDTETDYANRTYIVNSTFMNNTGAISNSRFTKITGSSFLNNSMGASIGGQDRSTIRNSTFSGNNTAIIHDSYLPSSFTLLSNNRLIDGNTFTNNAISISLSDGTNDNHKAQIWSTITNNTWDEGRTWIKAKKWDSGSSSNLDIIKTSLNTTGNEWVESGNLSSVSTTTTTPSTTIAPNTTTTSTAPPTSTSTTPPTTTPNTTSTVPSTNTTVVVSAINATVVQPNVSLLRAPSIKRAARVNKSSVTLAGSKVSGATRYQATCTKGTLTRTSKSKSQIITVRNLTPGKWSCRIRGIKNNVGGRWSKNKTVKI